MCTVNISLKYTKRKISTYGTHLSKYGDFIFARVEQQYVILCLSFFDSGISKMIGLEYFTMVTRYLKRYSQPMYKKKYSACPGL